MPLTAGSRIGHCGIDALLGGGGMGEVYRGRDTKLKREVAVKMLPAVFGRDGERLARFGREAQILASLNHPDMVAIYGLRKSESGQALVLEMIEGLTLEDRMCHKPDGGGRGAA